MNFNTNDVVLPYVQSIIRNLGHMNLNNNIGITINDFVNSYPFFIFNLSPDFDYRIKQVPKNRNLLLDVKFKEPLKKPKNIIIFGIFDDEVQITKNRNIIV
jgi:hypothetical protein